MAPTARAISCAQCGPGRAVHTARGAAPLPNAPMNAGPWAYRSHVPGSGTAGGSGGSGDGFASARAFLGGTASCSTSARLPAYRSATALASARVSALSTRSGETTLASAASGPE